MANALAVFNVFKWTDKRRRNRWMRLLMIILPLGWAIIGVAVSAPLVLVLFGGVLNAIYLIGVAISTVYLSLSQTDPRVKGGSFITVMMWISAVAICLVGAVGPCTTLFRRRTITMQFGLIDVSAIYQGPRHENQLKGKNQMSTEYAASRVSHDGATFWLQKNADRKELVVEGATTAALNAFAGAADGARFIGPANADNALALATACRG